MKQEDKELEIWKPIPNYEEYEISTFGRVKRLAYDKPVCGGSFQHCNERILSPQPRKNGYQAVMLSKKGVVKSFLIHRLVAITFISNPDNLPQVNHKDENPSNNHVENLEWCTAKYNSNYGTCKERIGDSNSRAILKYDLEGNFICEYKSMAEAERSEGINHATISICCSGRVSYQCGCIWIYKGNENTLQERIQRVKRVYKPRKVAMYDLNGKYIKTYNSVLQASKDTEDSYIQIDRQLKTGKITKNIKHIWKQI